MKFNIFPVDSDFGIFTLMDL